MIHRRNLRSLDEELQGLGCDLPGTALAAIADQRLDESAYNGSSFGVIGALGSATPSESPAWMDGHEDVADDVEDAEYERVWEHEDDPIDGRWVTHELLHRIEDLSIDESWLDGDTRFAQLLDGLAEKDVAGDDPELQARAEALVVFLSEGMRESNGTGYRLADALGESAPRNKKSGSKPKGGSKKFKRFQKTRGGFGKRAVTGFHKVPGTEGRYAKTPMSQMTVDRRERKVKMRGPQGAKKRLSQKHGKQHRTAMIRDRRGLAADRWSEMEDEGMSINRLGGATELASELRGLLDEETTPQTMFEETLDRMERVLGLIALHIEDEAVTDVLAEAWENATEQLHEDTDEGELMEGLRPVISLMAHCLKDIDAEDSEGN